MHASTVKNVFGGWTAALRAADLVPAGHGVWTREEVLDGLRAFARDHGRPPRTPDLRDTRGTPYPPATAVTRAWGVDACGLPPARLGRGLDPDQRRGDHGRAARL
jgi:hypothetical protein